MNIVKSALNLFGISKEDGEGGGVVDLDQFLVGLPKAMGFNVEFIRTQKDDGSHHIDIRGEEVTSFLGENTQLLDSLAHICMRVLRKQEGLANKAIEEGTELSKYRVTIDAEGFREKHYEGLKKVAEDAREKVLKSNGRPTYISALSPAERRVIHTHLAELGQVTSESIGNGTFKRIRVKLIGDTSRRPEGAPGAGRSDQPRNGGGHGGGGGGNFRRGRGPRRDFGRGTRPGQSSHSGGAGQGGGEFRRRNFDGHEKSSSEVNGNVAVPEITEEEIDDNIGNRDPHNKH